MYLVAQTICSCGVIFAGLARKEDFPHITYYCPHCHALNTSQRTVELESGTNSEISTPAVSGGGSLLLRNLSNASSTAGSEATSHTSATAHELPADATE